MELEVSPSEMYEEEMCSDFEENDNSEYVEQQNFNENIDGNFQIGKRKCFSDLTKLYFNVLKLVIDDEKVNTS